MLKLIVIFGIAVLVAVPAAAGVRSAIVPHQMHPAIRPVPIQEMIDMLDPQQFRELIVRPTLRHLKMWSQSAEDLLVGTAAHESRLTYLKQLGKGPALGVYQIEPATHDDIWENYLKYKGDLAGQVRGLASQYWPSHGKHEELIHNLAYATAIAWLVYQRKQKSAPLPASADLPTLAAYWKKHYNTPLGAGTVDHFIKHYPPVES